MKNFIKIILITVFMQNCALTQGTENTTVAEALAMQKRVVEDDLFFKILTELGENNTIDWSESRSASANQQELAEYDNNTDWLIAKYRNEGVYDEKNVFLWRKWNPFSSTTAATVKCNNSTKLNKWRLKRTKYSMLNTLIHERSHSFCTTHPSQNRQGNECDPAYVAGDLAQILIMYRDDQDLSEQKKLLCPGLEAKLKEFNILN